MRRLTLILALVAMSLESSCDRKGDFITGTSPFLSEYVPTPDSGHEMIAKRAGDFAKRHKMKLHYVPGHFRATEFTISVTRDDLNIVTGNVRLGNRTLVTATARRHPTLQQRAEVGEFMCSVMMHNCEHIGSSGLR
ncbi:MAG TPA: hypothetical protein VFO12_07940 [Sphingomicrobium sp.]|nr:hypothetical protein [Sphingomicrobium sp.]